MDSCAAISLLLLLHLSLLFLHPNLTSSAGDTETHIHFFFHDVVSGPSPTATRVAQSLATTFSSTSFGAVVMMDDPLTEGPDPSSKLLGHAQGMYALASKEETGALLMAMNLAFVTGDFNGSTLTILGRNTVMSDVREMPVVGGSGRFRFARGYALARTHQFSLLTGDAVVEYDVYVRHD